MAAACSLRTSPSVFATAAAAAAAASCICREEATSYTVEKFQIAKIKIDEAKYVELIAVPAAA